jgi:hypothetical protein
LGHYAGLLFVLGCLLVFWGLRFSTEEPEPVDDIAPWQGWFGLALLLLFSLSTSLVNLDVPNGYYCDDQAAPIEDTCKVRELHDYMIIMPYSFREPAGVYITAFLWNFFPGESGIHMQRLSGVVTALFIIWLMYLLGLEISSRRLGLLAAALITFSKWVPAEVISGYFTTSTTLAVCWSLLAFSKLLKKQTWFRFFHWALAISFGTYTYTAFRLFGFFMIFLTLSWILLKRNDFRISRKGLILCSFLGFFWLTGFLVANRILNPSFSKWLTHPIILTLAGVVFVLLLFWNVREFLKKGSGELALKFTFGLLVVAFLIFPLVTNRDYGSEVARLNIFNNGTNSLVGILQKIGFTFRAHFMGEGIFGTSAFDFQTACVVILGLLAFFSKPEWKTALIFLVLLVGMAPHFLADYTYNGRAAAGIPAVFFLGAFGIDRLRFWGQTIWNPRAWKIFFAFSVFCGLGWEAWTNYQIVYQHQIYARWLEALVSREVVADSPANRVYMSLYPYASSPACQGILDEGHPLYIFHDSNPIFRVADEPKRDIVVIVFKGDTKLTGRLNKDFPRAQWTDVNFAKFAYPDNGDGSDDIAPRFFRVLIPASEISNNPNRLIYYAAPAVEALWKRRFYWADNGLAHGAINYEDIVSSLRAPYPTNQEISTADFEGEFKAPADGDYLFSIRTACVVVLTIGDKKAIDLRPNTDANVSQNKALFLRKGSYPVRYQLYFRYANTIPEIQVTAPGSNGPLELDGFSQ